MKKSKNPFKRTVESRVLEYFLSYVVVDTQANPDSETVPTTPGQLELGKLLVQQLEEIGVKYIDHDDMGYIYATIPSTLEDDESTPVVAFLAHLDTSPECSGKDVEPQLWNNYDGGDLVLPDDGAKVIRVSDHPALKNHVGDTVITAGGTTLLGADNKAGIAAIMDAAYFLLNDSNAPKHGEIRLVFTPDEEIGRDADNINLEKVGADFAYTMDGGVLGEVSYENFNAHYCAIKIKGVPTHPGYAFAKMEPANKIVRAILNDLPAKKVPELTQGREPFIYEFRTEGQLEEAKTDLMLRAFTDDEMQVLYADIESAVNNARKQFPGSTIDFKFKEQYRNMVEVIEENPLARNCVEEALDLIDVEPVVQPIRGGTTGARLSFMGLPCPNIFVGEHAFHGYYEWTTQSELEFSSETIVGVVQCAVGKLAEVSV